MVKNAAERFENYYRNTLASINSLHVDSPEVIGILSKKAHDVYIETQKSGNYQQGEELLKEVCKECPPPTENSASCPIPPCPPEQSETEVLMDVVAPEGLTLGDLEALRAERPDLYADIARDLRRRAKSFFLPKIKKKKEKPKIPSYAELIAYRRALEEQTKRDRKK